MTEATDIPADQSKNVSLGLPLIHPKLPSVESAWAVIKHRVDWIESQFNNRDRHHLFSYIKSQALILAMRSALAALDALSELISA